MSRRVRHLMIAVVLSLLLLEVALRLTGRAEHLITDPAFETAPSGGYWRYRVGFEGRFLGNTQARIGPLGSRLHPSSSPGAAQPKPRIAVFGDSVTFGQGVREDETFSARLERRLFDEGLPVEVLNFGVQGHTVEMEVRHMTDRAADLRPACLILAFISDDLRAGRASSHVDRFGYLSNDAFGPPSLWMDGLRASLRRSHLALLTKEALLRLKERRRRDPEGSHGGTRSPEAELKALRESIGRLREISPSVTKLVFCADLEETDLTRKLAAVMEEEFPDVAYVQASPAFRDMPPDSLLIPRDRHPNARAHQVLADLLAPAVRKILQIRTRERDTTRSSL